MSHKPLHSSYVHILGPLPLAAPDSDAEGAAGAAAEDAAAIFGKNLFVIVSYRFAVRYLHPGKSHERQSIFTYIHMHPHHETDVCASSNRRKTRGRAEQNPGFAT